MHERNITKNGYNNDTRFASLRNVRGNVFNGDSNVRIPASIET